MKSNKQRKVELKDQKLKKRKGKKALVPIHAVAADPAKLSHNNTYDPFPLYYNDITYTCRACGEAAAWTAEQQKWWYEEAKGHIHSRAVHCKDCRAKIQAEKKAQQLHIEAMSARVPHPNEAFFKKKKI